jgi:NAD(P)-dependent dehydrogenase (short-subunit alcohol dehydrogenase family)
LNSQGVPALRKRRYSKLTHYYPTNGLDILQDRDINASVMNDHPLQGQVALVTGAGRRIGHVIALALARAGADLFVHYNESSEGARATVRQIEHLGGRAVAVRADVSRPKQVETMFRAVEKRFRRLDILVNNAGIFFPVRWDKLSEVDWDKVLGVNLKGAFFCAQAAARIMQRQRQGRIVIISSLGGLQAWPEYIHYCASKAGAISLTRSLAKALAPHIQVNSVAPGTILFPGERRDERMKRIISQTPLKKAGRPEDIAEMVLFLVTRSDFITGQVFVVDGGKSIP